MKPSKDKKERLLVDDDYKNENDAEEEIDLMKLAGEVDVPSDASDNESEFLGVDSDSSEDEADNSNTITTTIATTTTKTTTTTTESLSDKRKKLTKRSKKKQSGFRKEFKKIGKVSFLISMQLVFEFGSEIIANIMVGHFYDGNKTDDEYISAIGLATMFVDLTGDTVVWGLTSALHTLIPQAMGHPSEIIKHLCLRIYCQRAFIMTTIFGTICNILPFFAGKIMTLIGQPSYLEQRITYFAIAIAPMTYTVGYFAILLRLCQSYKLNVLMFLITFFGLVFSYPVMYVLMYTFNLGYIGAGLGMSIISVSLCIFTCIYLIFAKKLYFLFKPLPCNIIFNKDGIKQYFSLSLPGLFENDLDWWLLQLAVIFAGYVGNTGEETTSIATAVIMYNLFLVVISIGYGISNATCIRVAKFIGANNVNNAKIAAKAGFVVSLIYSFIITALFIIFNDDIATLWTHNEDTIWLAEKIMYIFAGFSFFLMESQYFSGLLKALGYEKQNASFVIIGYIGVCTPLFIVFFWILNWRSDLLDGSIAMWGSLGIANIMTCLCYIIYIFTKLDWTKAIALSEKRIRKTIESTTSTMDASDISLNNLDVDKQRKTSEDDML